MRLVIVILCVLAHLASARFIIEQGGLKIKFPASAAQQHQSGFDMSLANFGAPKYGGELVGKLVYVDKDHGHPNTCQPDCKYACQDFSQASPPFMLTPSAPGSSTPTTYIMMVDRGPIGDGSVACKFAEKVWNAQKAGAQGVLVVNFEDKLTTMEAPDEDDEKSYQYLRNITIPAAFITKSSGDALKGLLTSGPQQDGVYASMDWNNILPKAEKVEWEFWSNSNDICGPVCDVQKEFIKEFVPVARELEGNWTTFTPHYIVWVCPDVYRASEECQQQCIHNGRYCTPDPDGDLMAGYSGKDVVQENLRQLCVFRLGNETGRPWVWWEYVTQFGEECTMAKNSYNEECAEKVFIAIGGPNWSSLDKLRSCIGDMDADVNNPIMEAEMLSQQGDSTTGEVFILPTIRINNGQYRGKLGYTEVLRAICAGFNQDAEPTACLRVAEDDCRPGSAGESECRARTDGKTACKNTFSGYSCTCGSGFISHTDTAGQETCLNINECLTSSPEDLNPDCTCERCACQDTFGGYTCIKDIANECEEDYGGCWRGDFTVNGQKKTFHACHDNLETYQTQAAKGFSTLPELHNCQCPPCFTEYVSNGVMTCQPKCDLNTCDEATGICAGTAGDSGTPVYAVVLIVAAALSAVAVAGYAAYRWRLRSAMHQEIRAIMAQYMPLEASEAPNGHANLDARGETRGLTSPNEEL